MKLNQRAIRAIMRKDLRQVTQNKMVWLPMVILPLILLVIMPLAMVLLPTLFPTADADMEEVITMLDRAPAFMRAPLAETLTSFSRETSISRSIFSLIKGLPVASALTSA